MEKENMKTIQQIKIEQLPIGELRPDPVDPAKYSSRTPDPQLKT